MIHNRFILYCLPAILKQWEEFMHLEMACSIAINLHSLSEKQLFRNGCNLCLDGPPQHGYNLQ